MSYYYRIIKDAVRLDNLRCIALEGPLEGIYKATVSSGGNALDGLEYSYVQVLNGRAQCVFAHAEILKTEIKLGE